ncbi:hypothetical protein EVAR_29674_1 [Eumeta japonica]|uniref:Uncharacterized protein n=1 Tax=Eumeta variegata TaxID=151549 RepID=A0A4C1W7M3_EUMVA|nr:hypothetical protein EVAR_29674_1 [Eumeta japonica]
MKPRGPIAPTHPKRFRIQRVTTRPLLLRLRWASVAPAAVTAGDALCPLSAGTRAGCRGRALALPADRCSITMWDDRGTLGVTLSSLIRMKRTRSAYMYACYVPDSRVRRICMRFVYQTWLSAGRGLPTTVVISAMTTSGTGGLTHFLRDGANGLT